MEDDLDRSTPYLVVKNHEDQYSIWDASRAIPAGWKTCYGPASREVCLAHIRAIWVDMRPRSLRERASWPSGDDI
ncbi:MbtH family protein [Sinorhizobium meliloti]|uniref:MbtH family protein n=1 Tax=Rhizobium meliloti TaxID=382 RepID=UPI000FD83B7B|nr:MbtH family protein [Sinorhizobium meliloti]RVQ56047.1 MbtH family protein [Sinorhizobium meliloti]